MRKSVLALVGSMLMLLTTSACGPEITTDSDTDSGNASDTVSNKHESAPASPIAFGVSVPHGAVQLGPLVRWRSPQLIKVYTADLDAIAAEEEAERLREIEEKQAEDPTWTPPTPTPSPTATVRSSRDSFAKLDEIPRADTYVSLMRIDGKPTPVLRSLLAQLSVLLPESEIVTDDLSEYCSARNRRVTACALSVTGETPAGRTLAVHLSVYPGDVAERTSPIGSQERPVMTLAIRQLGDVRKSQDNRSPERLASPPDVSTTVEKTGWIWPKMDESTPSSEPVIAGWTAPPSADILLSGKQPHFATMSTYRTSITSEIANTFVRSQLGEVEPKVDVMAELNENIVSTYGTLPDKRQVRAVEIASARGNFVSLFILPRGW